MSINAITRLQYSKPQRDRASQSSVTSSVARCALKTAPTQATRRLQPDHRTTLKQQGRKLNELAAQLQQDYPENFPKAIKYLAKDVKTIERGIRNSNLPLTHIPQFMHILKQLCENPIPYRIWQSTQTQENPVCFTSAMRVAGFISRHPNATSFNVYTYLSVGNEHIHDGREVISTKDIRMHRKFHKIIHRDKSCFDIRMHLQRSDMQCTMDASDDFSGIEEPMVQREAMSEFVKETIQSNPLQQHFVISYLEPKKSGHSIYMQIDFNTNTYRLFDINHGLFEFPDMNSMTHFVDEHLFRENRTVALVLGLAAKDQSQ